MAEVRPPNVKVVHDLRTYLGVVVGMCDILESGELTHAQRRYVELVKKNGELAVLEVEKINV